MTESWTIQSAVPGVVWPGLPFPGGAAVLGLLHQFEDSQWWSAQGLLDRQRSQLQLLLKHAYETVPYYRERWDKVPDAMRLGELPLLTRRDLKERFADLKSRQTPAGHGEVFEASTSGSTGAPVRVLKTAVEDLYWRAITLRDHSWHGRQMDSTLAVIRRGVGHGSAPSWGPATEDLLHTGPCLMLDVDVDVDRQLAWLARHQPAYLLTYPSLAAELARTSLVQGLTLAGLREVRTLGEALDPEVRALCRDAWGAALVDMYSAEETGYIALQCPEHEHYHAQSECVHVEVLDSDGRPCAPGEVGRVVVTVLHNFAMPLIRYDIGDYAEVGKPCECGRGLPVLRRILGRARSMLVTISGERYWPAFGSRRIAEIPAIRQHQLVQKALDLVEARLVVAAPLTREEEDELRRHVLSRLPAGFRLEISYFDRIPRNPGGKFEEFVSEVKP